MNRCILLCATVIFMLTGNLCHAQDDIFDLARNNKYQELKRCLEYTKIDTVTASGYSLLHLSVYNNNVETVKLLLDAGADVNLQDPNGNTALMGACYKGYCDIVALLLVYDADPNKLNHNHANALFFAATFGHAGIVAKLLEHHINLEQKDSFGKTALEYAKGQEHTEIVTMLQSSLHR